MKTTKYERIPFYVDAPDAVTAENMEEMAKWCKGEIRSEGSGANARQYIKVHVHNPLKERQTKAFIGDRILWAGNGFKVYTPQAFAKSFRKVKYLSKQEAQRAGIRPPIEKRQKGNPKPKPPARKVVRVESVSLDKEPNAFGERVHLVDDRKANETLQEDVDAREEESAEQLLREVAEETYAGPK